MVEESIQDELSKILEDLERIGDLVAQKESDLGLVKSLDLVLYEEGIFELTIDNKSYFLDAFQAKLLFEKLKDLDV